MLGWGVVGVWMGMFKRLGCAGRAVLLANGATGRWLWKYPRSEPQKCEKASCVGIKRQNADYFSKRFQI